MCRMESSHGFVEKPDVDMGATAEGLEAQWDEYTLHNQGITEATDWAILDEELNTVMMAKSEDKSEAFLLTKRAGGKGILAWAWINNYYTATSGMGISARMAQIMNPKQAKKDEDVIWNVESWLDEIRELIAMGEVELPAGYKITALKMIANPRSRKKWIYKNTK